MNDLYRIKHLRVTLFVSLLVTIALLLWATGVPAWLPVANAEALSFISDTVSDSAPAVVANHTIVATTTNGMLNAETLTVTFPAGFVLTTITEDDIDIATGTEITTAADCTGSEQMGVAVSGQVVTFTACDLLEFGEIASSSMFEIEIGNHAAASGSGSNRITNPGTGTYAISVGGTMEDNGTAYVVILDQVTMDADVDDSFTFTISGVAASTTVNDDTATVTTALTTSTSLPFGTLEANVETLLAQRLNMTTNAANGFSVTVQSDGNLDSATGADIDSFANDGASSTPVAWESPVNYLNQEQTWGHIGLTSDDATLTAGNPFNDGYYEGSFTTSAVEVFYHGGPASGVTDHIGSTTVGYKIEITSLQEAADDYTATLTYIATPVF